MMSEWSSYEVLLPLSQACTDPPNAPLSGVYLGFDFFQCPPMPLLRSSQSAICQEKRNKPRGSWEEHSRAKNNHGSAVNEPEAPLLFPPPLPQAGAAVTERTNSHDESSVSNTVPSPSPLASPLPGTVIATQLQKEGNNMNEKGPAPK